MPDFVNIDHTISKFKKAVANGSKDVRFTIDELAGLVGDINKLLLNNKDEKIQYEEVKNLINQLSEQLKFLLDDSGDAGKF